MRRHEGETRVHELRHGARPDLWPGEGVGASTSFAKRGDNVHKGRKDLTLNVYAVKISSIEKSDDGAKMRRRAGGVLGNQWRGALGNQRGGALGNQREGALEVRSEISGEVRSRCTRRSAGRKE